MTTSTNNKVDNFDIKYEALITERKSAKTKEQVEAVAKKISDLLNEERAYSEEIANQPSIDLEEFFQPNNKIKYEEKLKMINYLEKMIADLDNQLANLKEDPKFANVLFDKKVKETMQKFGTIQQIEKNGNIFELYSEDECKIEGSIITNITRTNQYYKFSDELMKAIFTRDNKNENKIKEKILKSWYKNINDFSFDISKLNNLSILSDRIYSIFKIATDFNLLEEHKVYRFYEIVKKVEDLYINKNSNEIDNDEYSKLHDELIIKINEFSIMKRNLSEEGSFVSAGGTEYSKYWKEIFDYIQTH